MTNIHCKNNYSLPHVWQVALTQLEALLTLLPQAAPPVSLLFVVLLGVPSLACVEASVDGSRGMDAAQSGSHFCGVTRMASKKLLALRASEFTLPPLEAGQLHGEAGNAPNGRLNNSRRWRTLAMAAAGGCFTTPGGNMGHRGVANVPMAGAKAVTPGRPTTRPGTVNLESSWR
mmetsp:Transcript_64797/g.179125  ORF Transcript_64797/g.179125 Transcript_64797/m.179125 type:complete len:174 (-) Transcript_64797:59-580(-)